MRWSQRGGGLWDLHWPRHAKEASRNVLDYIKDERWDWWVLGGDILDMDLFSQHQPNDKEWAANASFGKEVLAFSDDWLVPFCNAVRKKNPKARVIWIEGNHEERVLRYLRSDPKWKDVATVPAALNLKSRMVEWVPNWSTGAACQIGHASFVHGWSTIQNHAAKHARDWGSNVFYGHSHDQQTFPIHRRAKNVTIKAQSMGCLCDFNQPYMRGKPIRWQHAFGVWYVWPDGSFQDVLVNIHKGRFVAPNGKLYGA